MKILLFDPWTVGHHINYAEHLARYFLEQGDEVHLATTKPTGEPYGSALAAMRSRLPELNIHVTEMTGKPGSRSPLGYHRTMLKTISRGLALAESSGADVFHHLYLDHSEITLYIATRGRATQASRFATAFKTPSPDRSLSPRGFGHRAHWLGLGRLLASGDLRALFVHSSQIRDEILEGLGRPDLSPRITVVPDPVASPPLMSRQDARKRLGVADAPLMLFFGELRESKGARVLLEALPLLSRDKDWQVLVAGVPTPAGAEAIRRCKLLLDRDDRLLAHLRYIEDEDIDVYFAAADAVILPFLRTHRGTSGILQRAAAATKPVIASDTGDVGMTVRSRELGMLFEPESAASLADAMEDFLADPPALIRSVATSAARYSADSDWRILGSRVRETYLRRASGMQGDDGENVISPPHQSPRRE